MTDHVLQAVYVLIAATITALIGALATRVRVLPAVIDLSIIPTTGGLLSFALTGYGAARRFDPDRIGRLSLGGTLFGGLVGVGILLTFLAIDVA